MMMMVVLFSLHETVDDFQFANEKEKKENNFIIIN